MRLFTKNNGAVSIFLVIILVPMLVVTSLFVDVARMHLGQAMVDSAGDLVLNTAMTDFDSELNDYYGLLGTCRSSEELKKVSKDFYENALKSAGLSSEDADNMALQLVGMFGEETGDISDLMNLEIVKDSFELKTIDNSGFNNPAIVKTQVINFMKYRSPINGVLNLLESVSQLSEQAGNVQEENELISEKKDMCEKQQSLMELLKSVYDNLEKYENCSADGMYICRRDDMKNMIKFINGYRSQFYQYAEEAAINFMYLDLNKVKNFNPKSNKVKIAHKKSRSMTITQAFIDMDQYILEYRQKRDALDAVCNISTTNQLRDAVVKAIKVPELYEDYVDTAEKLSKTYQNMIDAFESISNKEEQYPNTFESLDNRSYTYKETYNNFKGLYENYEKDFNGKNQNSSYYKIQNDKIEGVGRDKLNELRNQYDSQKTKLDNKLSALASKYGCIGQSIEDACEYLKDVEMNLNEIIKNGGALDKYNSSNEKWKNHADSLNAKGSDIAAEDVKMYSGPEKDSEGNLTDAGIQKGIKENVTREKVATLRTRVVAIRNNLLRVKEKLLKMKFGSDLVGKIDSVDKVNDKFTSQISRETFEDNLADTQKLKQIVKEKFNSLYKDTSENLSDDWVGNSMSKPDLKDDSLRNWLNKVFGGNVNTDKKEDYDKKYKNKSKEKANEKPEETKISEDLLGEKYKSSGNSIKALDGSVILPSKDVPAEANPVKTEDEKQSDDLKKSASMIGSLFSGIGSAVKNMATGFRDDLYAVDYITSMLSYDTYVNEGLYDVAKAKNLPVNNLKKTQASIQRQDVINTWKNEKITNTANKSLTNKEISTVNNYAFGGEAEYILYGFDSNAKNISSAYATIFTIRLGFNSVYAFKEYWKDKEITNLATAISVATQGIIPPALIKVAIILALAVAETVNDIAMLKAGMPVAVIKNKDNWQMQLNKVFENDNNLKNANGSNANHQKIDLSLRYSDYIKIFLMISMMAGNENKIYTRLADVVQCNMALITNNNKYSLSEHKTWFTVSSKVMVKPLMLDLPWTKDAEGNPKDDASWYTLSYRRSNGYY